MNYSYLNMALGKMSSSEVPLSLTFRNVDWRVSAATTTKLVVRCCLNQSTATSIFV